MKEIVLKEKALYSELQGGHSFGSKVSSKMFYVLASQLYKNKIRAIIRELSCNAVDAHKAAGNPGRFDVILPNLLNPQFKVRDYGTGISEEDMYNVFTVLFESTKENSNDFTGMLGLGSKSPFAYTDNYLVTSYQNGTMKVYSAFMESQKVPTLDKIHEEATDEPNGLCVQFAVDEKDFYKFFDETRYVFRTFWDIKPNIISTDPSLTIEKIQEGQKEWCGGKVIVDSNHYQGGWYVVQGDIPYPINYLNPERIIASGEYFSASSDVGVFVRLDIGSVSFTPSREELENTDHNKAVIENALKSLDLYEEITKDYVKQVIPIRSQFDACLKMDKFFGRQKINGFYIHNAVREIVTKAGFIPQSTYEFGDITRLKSSLGIHILERNRYSKSYLILNKHIHTVKDENTDQTTWVSEFSLSLTSPLKADKVVIVLDDTKKKYTKTTRYLKEKHRDLEFIIIENPEKKKDLAEFMNLFSGIPVKVWKFSQIEKHFPNKKTGVRVNKHKWFISGSGLMEEHNLIDLGINPGDKFFYIPVSREYVEHPNVPYNCDYSSLKRFINNSEEVSAIVGDLPVIRIRHSREEMVKKHYKDVATNLVDVLISRFKEVASVENLALREGSSYKTPHTKRLIENLYNNLEGLPLTETYKKLSSYEESDYLSKIISLYGGVQALIRRIHSKEEADNFNPPNLAKSILEALEPEFNLILLAFDTLFTPTRDIIRQAQMFVDAVNNKKEVFES